MKEDIVDKLEGLIVQATKERSHYYVRSTAYEAVEEIKKLRLQLMKIQEALLTE